jgi:hypothetical protein
MKIAEILQVKDLRIQVLEEQLTACKSDRKRLKKQLKLYVVNFCLPVEGDSFEIWFHKHFTMLGNTMVECKNQTTIKYNQEDILELYSFLNDRWLAN